MPTDFSHIISFDILFSFGIPCANKKDTGESGKIIGHTVEAIPKISPDSLHNVKVKEQFLLKTPSFQV